MKSTTPSYTIIGLGTLGGDTSSASDINNRGHIAGWATTARGEARAFLWRNGKMIELGVLAHHGRSAATAINDKGQVVGISEAMPAPPPPRVPGVPDDLARGFWAKYHITEKRAVLWESGAIRSLASPPGRRVSGAVAVNNTGRVVGWTRGANFLWHRGKATDLGISGVSALNDRGVLVGTAATRRNTGDSFAFVWRDGRRTELGTLAGGRFSRAHAINNKAQIVGASDTAGRVTHAFFRDRDAMRDLGALPGYARSAAWDINENGHVVGWSSAGLSDRYRQFPFMPSGRSPERAVLWRDGHLADLNDLIAPGSGWVLHFAAAINERGMIVGSGSFRGKARAYLLTPR